MEQLERLYTQDIEFRDPRQRSLGILALQHRVRHFHGGPRHSGFEYIDEQIAADSASFTWQAQIQHPLMARGQELQLRGVTQVRFTDRIYYHEDFYDLGLSLYQQMPLMGPVIRLLNRRLFT